MQDMNKWFKMFDEWRLINGYNRSVRTTRKEQGQIFTQLICKSMGIVDKINWRTLDSNKVAKELGCTYTDEDGCTVSNNGLFRTKEIKFE